MHISPAPVRPHSRNSSWPVSQISRASQSAQSTPAPKQACPLAQQRPKQSYSFAAQMHWPLRQKPPIQLPQKPPQPLGPQVLFAQFGVQTVVVASCGAEFFFFLFFFLRRSASSRSSDARSRSWRKRRLLRLSRAPASFVATANPADAATRALKMERREEAAKERMMVSKRDSSMGGFPVLSTVDQSRSLWRRAAAVPTPNNRGQFPDDAQLSGVRYRSPSRRNGRAANEPRNRAAYDRGLVGARCRGDGRVSRVRCGL